VQSQLALEKSCTLGTVLSRRTKVALA
jgi:hypothetical protein